MSVSLPPLAVFELIRTNERARLLRGFGLASLVVMLVARRAGLNPFVTMPAVFGVVLFFTLPLLKQTERLNNRILTIFVWSTLTICLVATFARGWTRHSRFDAQPSLDCVKIGSLEIHRIAVFSRPARADWARVGGRTNSEKMDTLIDVANASIDYLILPDEKTAKELELSARHNHINRHLVALRQQIVGDDSWIRVASDIPTNESEIVEIYRKRK